MPDGQGKQHNHQVDARPLGPGEYVVDAEAVCANERIVEQGFWPKLKKNAGRLPFARDAVAAYFAARDPQTPARTKAILFGALAYFVIPTDLLPDFIAGFGFTDDATVLAAAMAALSGVVKQRHQDKAREALGAGTSDQDKAD